MTDNPPLPMPAPRGRDRTATRAAILASAKAILAAKGFAALGVNIVARDAGCDKQLVYRYFGGLEGLVDAIGEDLANWVVTRIAPPPISDNDSYGTRLTLLLHSYIDGLRDDPLMRAILAWEVSDGSPHVQRLTAARSRAMGQWMGRLRGTLTPPTGLDAAALNAILIAAIQHLVLAGGVAGVFVGVPLQAEADWDRIKHMVARIIAAMHGDQGQSPELA